jgi:hypothetical protein
MGATPILRGARQFNLPSIKSSMTYSYLAQNLEGSLTHRAIVRVKASLENSPAALLFIVEEQVVDSEGFWPSSNPLIVIQEYQNRPIAHII